MCKHQGLTVQLISPLQLEESRKERILLAFINCRSFTIVYIELALCGGKQIRIFKWICLTFLICLYNVISIVPEFLWYIF